jgi:hypothetical protein
MNEDERFARNTSTISIGFCSQVSLSIYEHHFGDLRTASIADHTLICKTTFFTFTVSHKSVHSQRVLLTHFSWCASSAQPAVTIFFQFHQPAFDKNALLESEHFEDSILAGKRTRIARILQAKVFGSVFQ